MRKICVVIGSRANYGRLKSVLKAIEEHPKLKFQLITAASAYDLPIDFRSNAKIQCLIDGDDTNAMSLTTGVFLTQIGGVLQSLNPDIVLIHGDRYEMLAVAIAASYQNITIAHTEGGESTGSIDDKVRNAITTLADIHFAVTKTAQCRIGEIIATNTLLNEIEDLMGYFERHKIYLTGSTALDSLINIDLSSNRKEPYIVILHHPNTTNPESLEPLIEALPNIHKVWVNPNVDAGNKSMLKLIHKQKVEFVKNLPIEEYARLIKNCACLVGNTSSGIKEGAFLGVPYVCVGNRQQNREVGINTIRVSNNTKEIKQAIEFQMKAKYEPDYRFGDGTAAEKIVKVLLEGLWIKK